MTRPFICPICGTNIDQMTPERTSLNDAAPDLLAVCNALIKYLDGERPALDTTITNLNQLEAAARAAIDKATGE